MGADKYKTGLEAQPSAVLIAHFDRLGDKTDMLQQELELLRASHNETQERLRFMQECAFSIRISPRCSPRILMVKTPRQADGWRALEPASR